MRHLGEGEMELSGWRNSSLCFLHPSQDILCCVEVIQHLPAERRTERAAVDREGPLCARGGAIPSWVETFFGIRSKNDFMGSFSVKSLLEGPSEGLHPRNSCAEGH